MKSKKLLFFVPLALVLSSCGHSPKVAVETKTNPIIPEGSFIEDTTLHDEVFKSVNEIKVRKTFTPVDSSVPAIGIQTYTDNKGTVDEEDDTMSVRFVAAVAIQGDLGSATAVWTRAMFDTSGNTFKATATKACTAAYTSLATSGSPYTIQDYNNSCGGSYTHFVAYTMRNIPLSDYSSYYFTAYLTLNDGSGETVSKAVATTVDQTTQFSFNHTKNGYFAIKRTGSGFETIDADDFDNNGHYNAEFEGMSFTVTDSFLIVNRALNHFQVFGYDAAHAEDPLDTEFGQLGSSQFLDCHYERSYFIHLNEYNRISVEEAFAKTFYFKPNTNWNDGVSKYIITLKHDDESSKRVYEMFRIGETNTYQYDCFYTASMLDGAPIAFYKLPSGESLDLTDKPHSQNLGWPLRNEDMFTMNKGNDKGYWSLRTEADPVIETGNFDITDFTEAVEIHTDRQKEYLAYTGDYTQMSTSDYPDGDQHISNSLPVEIDFNYSVPGAKEIDHFSVIYGREPDLSDGYETDGDTSTFISFYNPYLGKNYYKLVAHFTDSTTEESQIHNFYVDATNPRNLTIDGMTNCRDLGGKLLEDGGVFKQGLVYRTSGKNQSGLVMTEATTEEMINHLGLRNEIYVADRGSSYACNLAGAPVNNFYMDWQATDGSSNFSRNTEPLKKFFNFMADSNNYPVFFHCKIGTDRTGLCATMLCGLLGVSLNEIYQDYLFSNFGAIGGKRYIGEAAGHDNILRYTEYIQSFSGDTFKNKVYNVLLSIGISRATLDAVINNLTEGPRATGNNAGQLSAFGNQLTGHGVNVTEYDNSDYSNHPAQYYSLTGPSESVSYTFNAPQAYQGQVIAYIGNGDNSNVTKLDYSLGMALDGDGISIRDVSFQEAGMGRITTSYSRWMYYPVILGIVDLSAGEHTIEINGRSGTMNLAGITILNASSAVDLGGGGLSGEDPKHVHDYYYNYQITTNATCEHVGEERYECSCGDYYTAVIPKLSHEWTGPIINNSAGTDGVNNYPAEQGYNCSLCNKGALRWSAMDYDASSSEIENNGSYIRMNSSQQANAYGDGVEGGGHLIYKINVPTAIEHAGLSFDILAHSANVAIFDTVSGDSGMGKDFINDQVVNPEKRYALYVNDVRIELGADPGPSTARAWFDWPVDFSLNAGVNKIEIVNMGGYRARMYNFQLTGFDAFVNNHEHEYGSWQHDDYYHWKECTADGCSYEEGHHFDEDYHTFGDIQTVNEPTCTANGSGTQTCITCGYTKYVDIPALGHDWIEGAITVQPTCSQEGTREIECSRCHAEDTTPVSKLDHVWSNEVTVPAGDEGQVAYYTSTCSVGHENRIRISATDGTFAEGSSNKDGTPAGYIKLNGNGQSISYTFTYSGETTTAKIYQRAIFDSWTSSGNRTSSYSTKGTGEQGCNFEFSFNGNYIDLSETKNIQYQTMLNGGTDTGLGSSYSYMADCLMGTITLNQGLNTFTYKRVASMNLLVHDYIIVFD